MDTILHRWVVCPFGDIDRPFLGDFSVHHMVSYDGGRTVDATGDVEYFKDPYTAQLYASLQGDDTDYLSIILKE